VRDLCGAAVDAALGGGAAYADARAVFRRSQSVSAKNGRVDTVNDVESEGIGVRVLVGGAWGFASDRRLTAEGARDAALRACAFARASGSGSRVLAPVNAQRGTYKTSFEIDPFSVSLGDKVDLCLRAAAALGRPEVKVAEAFVRAQLEHKVLISSDGADVEQEIVECGAGIDATAVGDGIVQVRSYPSAHSGSSAQAGWEYVLGLELEREAPRVAEQAAALLTAPECPSGVMDLVIDHEQMQLQVHESVGHPTELDRVLGYEAAYAGTSFLHANDVGTLRYGSEHMNITSDPTTPAGLGTFAFDDEGVAAAPQPIVREGVLVGWLGSREVGFPGSMRADNWNRMPLVRMTNLHLDPGEGTLDELIAGVDRGLFLETNKSWSIDDKRLNFQFGTQLAWEIVDGKLGRMLRDATYTGITPRFWGSLDAVAGPDAWKLHGLTNCGKGQPGQSAHVSHGAAPARFRNVQVGVRA
jgi:TldD protein